jgi:hypothetical protein
MGRQIIELEWDMVFEYHVKTDVHFQNRWPSLVIELEGENEVELVYWLCFGEVALSKCANRKMGLLGKVLLHGRRIARPT